MSDLESVSSEVSNISNVIVDFDFNNPEEKDYHPVKSLLTLQFGSEGSHVPNLSNMADIIVEQGGNIGTCINVDDMCMAINTIIDLSASSQCFNKNKFDYYILISKTYKYSPSGIDSDRENNQTHLKKKLKRNLENTQTQNSENMFVNAEEEFLLPFSHSTFYMKYFMRSSDANRVFQDESVEQERCIMLFKNDDDLLDRIRKVLVQKIGPEF
ncbi:hypothetical protein O9G_001890 [Rozella allomycis CSF55]|uniref:Uncharacterized protein n=1 Tax=Rozella allomycis (strain CSF55) TaxID=988480 RepID=A0A075AWV2_ROZAC|nr:hypothetical protein O9G_001890 [Rozella allomycis CSF55]|eukprot:EPZ34589.1 hypothetical protein O9G_001890 [Rozella allomycis CSF55]